MSTQKSIITRRAASNRLHTVAELLGLAAISAAFVLCAFLGCFIFD